MKKRHFTLLTLSLAVGCLLLIFFLGQSKDPEIIQAVNIDRAELKKHLMTYSHDRLLLMFQAGEEVKRWSHLLARTKSNILEDFLRGQRKNIKKKSVFDTETLSEYLYHSHRKGEHGHFHLYMNQNSSSDDEGFTHLIAISLSEKGIPIKLFTTNRWVTGGEWYDDEAVLKMIERFEIHHTYPSWVTNQWLSAMLRLFYPQIEMLIRERELKLSGYPTLEEAMNDQDLEVLSEVEISVETQMEVLRELIEREFDYESTDYKCFDRNL